MSELTEIETALNKIAEGGVSEFSVNGQHTKMLNLKDLMALKNQLKDESLDNLSNGTGRGITGANFENQ